MAEEEFIISKSMTVFSRVYKYSIDDVMREAVFRLVDLNENEDGKWSVGVVQIIRGQEFRVNLKDCLDSMQAVEDGCVVLRGWIRRLFANVASLGISLRGEGVDSWI